jgi:hypothetical protein
LQQVHAVAVDTETGAIPGEMPQEIAQTVVFPENGVAQMEIRDDAQVIFLYLDCSWQHS